MSLIAELKRRNVFRVGAAYAVVAWLLVEVASVVLPTFEAPEWVMQVFTFLLILGFPIALVFAWAFELTPDGLKREMDVDPAESITHLTGRKLDFLIISVLAVAVAYLIVDKFVFEPEPKPVGEAGEQIQAAESAVREKSIAVLPFANRSLDEADALFVDGMHDDILNHISKIRSLKVISRTSVMEYRDTKKNLKTIGRELGAETVLEGGIQRAGDHVRINVQLIDAETDEHLWANIYDRELTTANIFAIQTEIAKAIAEALKTALSPEEKERLERHPTTNLAAYEGYIIGKERLAAETVSSLTAAIEHFQQAVELDPGFALAYAGLAESHLLKFFYTGELKEERLAKAQAAVDKALELDDQMGEAHNALAAILEFRGDLVGAESEYRRALELNPNYTQTYSWYGYHLREELGRADEALALHMRAIELDPLSADIAANIADDLRRLGRREESLRWYERAIELEPEMAYAHSQIGVYYWNVRGRLDEGVVWLTRAVSLDPKRVDFTTSLGLTFLDLGDVERAEYWIEQAIQFSPEGEVSTDSPEGEISKDSVGGFPRFAVQLINLYRGDESSLEAAREAIDKYPGMWPPLALLRNHELERGRPAEARALYEAAFDEWLSDDAPTIDRYNFEDAINIALVLIRTGERERAERLLENTLVFVQSDSRLSRGFQVADARIYALRGEKQKALSALRRAVDEGWRRLWWYYLERDPTLESLRDEPEYQSMVAEIEADMAAQLARVREMERIGELESIPEISATTH